MNKRVVVTGIGAITSLGNAAQTWEGICQNQHAYYPLPTHITKHGTYRTNHAAFIQDFNPSDHDIDTESIDRFVQLAHYCSKESMVDAGLQEIEMDPARIGVIMGSGVGSGSITESQLSRLYQYNNRRVSPKAIQMGTINSLSGYLAIMHNAQGPNMTVSTACASGNHAISMAYDAISTGKADIMLTGGSDSPTSALTYAGFDNMRVMAPNDEGCYPFSKNRVGFVLGEGAAVLVLESYEHAMERKATIYGEILGYGMSCDAYHMVMPVTDGTRIARTMQMAMEHARVSIDEIDYINAHGTGTVAGDIAEITGIKSVLKDNFNKVPISSIKGGIGHTLGASGAIEAAICMLALQDGKVPPNANLLEIDEEFDVDIVTVAKQRELQLIMSNSFGFGGNNCSILISNLCNS